MLRAAFVIAMLSATGAPGAAAPSAAVSKPVPLRPRIVPVDTALAAAAATDSVWVHHNTAPRAALTPPDLASRLRDVLLRPERLNPSWDPPEVCVSCPDQLIVYIGIPTLASFSPRLEIMVFFREAQVRYKTLDGWVGWSSIRTDGAGLLDLVKQALPADSVVQSSVWSPSPDSLSQEGAPEESLPKFGDYLPVDELPEALVRVPPKYPADAESLRIDGTVFIQVLVNRAGSVVDSHVVKSIPPLDSSAVAAVRQWKFRPAIKQGRPTAVWVLVPVKFALP